MNSIYKKYIKLGSILIGSLFALLVLTTWCIDLFFKDKLIKYALNQTNQQLNAIIIVSKADLTFWKTFPNASVEFGGVVLRSFVKLDEVNSTNKYKSDTLLVSSKVYFTFNLVKLLNNKYVLKRIQISDGYIFLISYKNGTSNFDIIKKKTTSNTSTSIDLNSLVIKNCSIIYVHENSELDIIAFTDKTSISGDIRSRSIDLEIESDLKVASLSINNYNYLLNKDLVIKTLINVSDNSIYTFKASEFILSGLTFRYHGTYSVKPQNYLRFSITGENLNLNDLVTVLPSQSSQMLQHYKMKGKCGLQLSIDGRTGGNFLPAINLKFNLTKGYMEESTSKIELLALEIDGNYTNGKGKKSSLSNIKLKKCTGNIGSGNFSIDGRIENIIQPNVYLNVNTELNLNELKHFFQLDTFEVLDGRIQSNFVVTGSPGKLREIGFDDSKSLYYKGQLEIKNASFKLKNNEYSVNNINGLIKLDNDLYFNNLSLYLHNNQILINGKMVNGLPYLFRLTNKTAIEADVSSINMDLSNYFVKGDSQPTGSYSRALLFPKNIEFDIKLKINDFKLNKFNAKWVSCNLFYMPGMFVIKSASFETCEGKISGKGTIVQDISKSFLVKGQLDVAKVNIKQLFNTFNNFGQKVVSDINLKGKLSGKIDFSSVWNSELAFLPGNLIVESDVTIFNGELVNFKPLLGLSRFIALEELRNVKFSTLHNNIFIKDKQIVIPQMDIQSSAFNISGSGIHNFDNRYNYKIRVLLSEFLYSKAKRAKKENEEYGRVEDDGLGKTSLFLNIEGKGSIYKISYDTRKTIDIVKESLSNQKRELREIFRDEFGWFKKDSTLGKSVIHRKPVLIEFEDSTVQVPKNQLDNQNKKKVSHDKVQVEWE